MMSEEKNQSVTGTAMNSGNEMALPQRILIAEDEHLIAKGMSDGLGALGIEIVGPAANGKRALELAADEAVDLAIVDIRMPEMDGLEASRLLFAEHNIPTVIVSAFSDAEYIDRAAAMGVFGYLLKPVNIDDLRATISVAWQRFRENQELTGEVAALEKKLADRKIIEKAKGLIMKQLGIDEPEAMRRLQKQARDGRRPMVELAQAILDSQEVMNSDKN